ncbi:MAG TPA: MFS transporter [Candidatus Limnocylindria bacterium]|nr:MFS transporter [Candidatus Limnocylindria bacterium]
MIARSLQRFSPYGRELPAEFWFLWLGTVINRLGGFAVPFLMLYLTAKLQMDPASAALYVSGLGAGSFVAQLVGGEIADRFGRRPVLLFSLFTSPLAMLTLGIARDTWLIAVAMFLLGFLTDLFRPAMSAAVVDLVPAEKRTRAFGYIYWAINLGAALAPIAAGLLANFDYFLLFLVDAVTTAAFGVIVLLRVSETQAAEHKVAAKEANTRARLGMALGDPMLLFFFVLSVCVGLIYSQSHVTLPLDMAAAGLPPSDYGLAIAVNGFLIILVTLKVARLLERLPRYPVIAFSALLLGAGFGLTALASTLPFYALTVIVWTVGEVIGAAVAPVIVSDMSPAALRGLYQGIWGSSWGLAFFIGPALGGFIFGQYGPAVLWTGTFVLGIVIALGFLALSIPARRRHEMAQASSR